MFGTKEAEFCLRCVTPLETWIWEKALSYQLYLLLICTGKLDKTNAAFDKVKELLLPVLTTTPKWTRILSARRKPCYIWRDSNGISGPIGYKSQCDLLMLLVDWPGRKIDSNSGYKKKYAWRLAQAVILVVAMNLMSSGPSLVFF